MFRTLAAASLAALMALPANAGPVSFADWKEQRLSLFSSNDYRFGASLQMVSEGSVSIAWTRLPEAEWDANGASWRWQVDQSVPPTNLGQKGGDDRNISLYFVFLPEAEAQAAKNKGIRSLLGNKSVRIIQYAWGGNHARGQVIKSPYGPSGQGVTVALRQAGTGTHSESVNLAKDFQRAFGVEKTQLVGLAVSGDSDDTDTVIRAAIANLSLK